MDTTDSFDRDLIKPEIEISGPLDVRRLQGNARCEQCKKAGKDYCLLERNPEGNFCCLRCASPSKCHFRRLVLKEAPASSFTWDQLLANDPGVKDALTIDTATSNSRSKKRTFDQANDENHRNDQHQWARPDLNRLAAGHLVTAGRSRVGLQEDWKRLFASLSPDQAQLLISLYERHPPLHNKDLCPIRTTQKLRQNQSIASEPASQIRTQVPNIPLQNIDPYPFNPMINPDVGPGPDSTSVYMNETGSWADQLLLLETDYLTFQNTYNPPLTLLIDERQPLMYNKVNNIIDDFDSSGTTPHLPAPAPSPHPTTTTTTIPLPYHCPTCLEILHTRSEARKHIARHTKPFLCGHDTCARSTPGSGFATRNDLDRHVASLHRSAHAFSFYRCKVAGCRAPDKLWTRKDNFHAHLRRMHPEVDSRVWLERCVERGKGEEGEEGGDDDGEEGA